MSDAKKYRVLTGLNYQVDGEEKRAEAGDVVSDLPPESVKWLLGGNHVEVVQRSRKSKSNEEGDN